jgi:hypothetical protein
MTELQRSARPATLCRRAFAVVLTALLGCATIVFAAPTAGADTPAQVRAQEWWISRLGLPDAWKISKGKGVTVAVVDLGVDTSVGDLRGATVPGFTVDGTAPPTQAYDAIGHGTQMSVYIAGRGTNPGIIGVAPQAKIMPVFQSSGAPDITADALNKLSGMAHPPQVVNMSFGSAGPCGAVLQTAVQRAVDKGLILVASAGNNGSTSNDNQSPSNCKGVVAVGAFDYNAKPWTNTQRQPYVSLGGPGVHMVAYNKHLSPETTSGTSNAAAMVSGEIAVVKAHFPKLTSRQIVARMFATASKSTYHGPRYGQAGDTLGFGPALVHQALIRNVPLNAPNPVYDDLAKLSGASTPSSSPSSAPSQPPESPSAPRTSHVNFPGTSDSPAATGSDSSGGSNVGLIIAAVAGGVVIIALVLFFLVRRKRTSGPAPL